MVLDVEPPQSLSTPLQVPEKLLMGAGPSNASERVLRAGALPLVGHLHAEFVKVYASYRTGHFLLPTCCS